MSSSNDQSALPGPYAVGPRAAEAAHTQAMLPVDMAHLRDMTGDDEAELHELVMLYLEQMTAELARLDAALAAHDATGVHRCAHICAGASASCGMSAVINPLRALERVGADGQLAAATDLRLEVELGLGRLKFFLARRLNAPHLCP
jgi:HPt (histidine-containing phosphotransfer) domain-containing protein